MNVLRGNARRGSAKVRCVCKYVRACESIGGSGCVAYETMCRCVACECVAYL